MRFDTSTLMTMQRKAYAALTAAMVVEHEPSEVKGLNGPKVRKIQKQNSHYVPPKLTSSPAMLVQELPWVNSTTNFVFDFSINGPVQTPLINNNVQIKKNDLFAVYAFQLLFSTGSGTPGTTAFNSANCVYRSYGVLPNDESVYNSIIQFKLESSVYVDKMEGYLFKDKPNNSNEFYGEIGMQIINPIRIISGELGTVQVIVNLKNPIGALTVSANTMLSMRLHGVYGQAQG